MRARLAIAAQRRAEHVWREGARQDLHVARGERRGVRLRRRQRRRQRLRSELERALRLDVVAQERGHSGAYVKESEVLELACALTQTCDGRLKLVLLRLQLRDEVLLALALLLAALPARGGRGVGFVAGAGGRLRRSTISSLGRQQGKCTGL